MIDIDLNRRDRVCLVVLTVAVVTLAGSSATRASAAAPPARSEPSGQGELRGRVSNEGGRPRPRARLRLYGEGTLTESVAFPVALVAETATDEAGSFSIPRLAQGWYSLTVWHGSAAMHGVRGFFVAGDRPTDVGTIRLRAPSVRLRGRAVDAAGLPLGGAIVRLMNWGGGSTPDPPVVFETITRSDGRYELRVPPAYYSMEAAAPGSARSSRSWLHLGSGRTRDVVLLASCALPGRAVDRDGRPVTAAHIEAEHRETGRRVRGLTASDGSFRLFDVAPGVYDVVARQGGVAGGVRQVEIACGPDDSQLTVPLNAGATVRVRVLAADGTRLAGLSGTIRGLDPPLETRAPDSASRDLLEFEGVPPGQHQLMIEAPGYTRYRRRVNVPAPGMGVQTEITLDREAAITGRVVSDSGKGAAGAQVRAVVRTPENREGQSVAVDATTDTRGHFELRGLPPGAAVVTAFMDGSGAAQTTDLALQAGGSTTIDLKLSPPAAVSGRVRYSDGRPAAGVRIETVRPGGEAADVWPRGFAITDPDGTYRLAPIDPGDTYVAAAREGNMQFALTDAPLLRQRRISVVAAKETRSVDFTLPTAHEQITGRVTDAQGRGVGGATVSAYEHGDASPADAAVAVASSASDGRFVLEGLEAVDLYVRATHPAFAESGLHERQAGGPPISLVLHAGATVRGHLAGSNGARVGECTVDLVPRPAIGETSETLSHRIETVPRERRFCLGRGEFELRRVPPGDYELRVGSNAGMTSRILHLEDGQVAEVDLAVEMASRSDRSNSGIAAPADGRILEIRE